MAHEPENPKAAAHSGNRIWLRWLAVIVPPAVILLCPMPESVTPESWRLLAIFVGTVAGMITHPLPGGAMVLLGVLATAISGALPIKTALGGFADPIVWLVLAAFFISRGMIKTGLGRRIALLFIRAIGHRSLGLGYALVCTDMILGSVIPSNAARAGGVIFPIARSLVEAYDSYPGPTARRLGSFMMTLLYQCDVIICAMFLTGQASNPLIAEFAKKTAGVEIGYSQWLIGAAVPGLLSLLAIPCLLYLLYPPEVKHTPEAADFANAELAKLGPLTRSELIMLVVFGMIASLWMFNSLHNIHYAVVALIGVGLLLITGVVEWDELMGERAAWDVFIWYGGLVGLADALGKTGLTELFAKSAAAYTEGWPWWWALAALLLVYFFAHYAFASITAHSSAMYMPFVAVTIAAGAPPLVAALTFAYLSNLDASLTHYGTTPAPIYFGARYVPQGTWWKLGLIVAIPNILIWTLVGPVWWKFLGWW